MRLAEMLKGLVNVIVGIVAVVLGLRFIFKLFSANADNGLVQWVYNSSAEIMGPFRGIFPTAEIEGSVIDFPALFAIFMYGLFGLAALYLIGIFAGGTKKR